MNRRQKRKSSAFTKSPAQGNEAQVKTTGEKFLVLFSNFLKVLAILTLRASSLQALSGHDSLALDLFSINYFIYRDGRFIVTIP
jgi:hypothetical protein